MTDELALNLELLGVAGAIATPARDVLGKAERLVAGDPDVLLGLDRLLPATLDEVLDALKKLGGWRPDASGASGGSHIEPAMVVEQAHKAGARLRDACRRRERVFFGTGHPTGPLELYLRLADAMAARGADILQVAEDEPFEVAGARGRFALRYVGGVACQTDGAGFVHTHAPDAMEYVSRVGVRPDLVVGDHGFAGVALARGVDALGLVDTNDPALVLAWGRGLPFLPILCDDNRPPSAYAPLKQILLGALDD